MAAATSSVTQSELRTMGRDTIAGLIAGILQKYSHEKKEVLPLQPDTQKQFPISFSGRTAGKQSQNHHSSTYLCILFWGVLSLHSYSYQFALRKSSDFAHRTSALYTLLAKASNTFLGRSTPP